MNAFNIHCRDVHGNGIPNWTGNPMGMGIKHRIGNENGREIRMGNHLSWNGNYLHYHSNLYPKVLCCYELIKLLVLYLPDANAYCAEFADYRNVIYSAPCAGLCIPSVRQTSTFPFPVH